ncbi:hypothetical protein V5O48_012883 [Marasmius crinis-equi]|uniref:Uncharacterized protein n=1 Tax=Marasmius crinis-equi TaxID=585013 RepID=A0ABR3F1R7_9AGAR
MGYNILFSDALSNQYPTLESCLNGLLKADRATEDVEVLIVPAFTPGLKTVQWRYSSELTGGMLTALCMEGDELLTHISNDALTKTVQEFRKAADEEDQAQRTVLLVLHPGNDSADRRKIDEEMCRRELQFPCLHRVAQSVDKAAYIIHTYTRGLWKVIANPTPEEVFDMYRSMLAVIPGMNPDRVALVTGRFRSMRSLHNAFRQMDNELASGVLALNESLFLDGPVDTTTEDLWVHNLYTMICSSDPDAKLYDL